MRTRDDLERWRNFGFIMTPSDPDTKAPITVDGKHCFIWSNDQLEIANLNEKIITLDNLLENLNQNDASARTAGSGQAPDDSNVSSDLSQISFDFLLNFLPIKDSITNITDGYLKAVAPGLAFITIFTCLRCYSEGMTLTKPRFIIAFSGMLLNFAKTSKMLANS